MLSSALPPFHLHQPPPLPTQLRPPQPPDQPPRPAKAAWRVMPRSAPLSTARLMASLAHCCLNVCSSLRPPAPFTDASQAACAAWSRAEGAEGAGGCQQGVRVGLQAEKWLCRPTKARMTVTAVVPGWRCGHAWAFAAQHGCPVPHAY